MAKAPFGYKRVKDGQTTRWEVVPEEATTIREMYRLAVEENLGFKRIADRLNAEGHRSKSGKPFAAYTIEVIVKNPAMAGTLVYGRRPRSGLPQDRVVRTPDVFPPILTPQEWQRLQERLALRREHPKGLTFASNYLLSGIARCGYCGGPMVGKVGALKPRKEARYRNYYCSRAFKSKDLCTHYNGHSAPRLEKTILEYLGQFTDADKVKEYLAVSESHHLEHSEAELAQVVKALAALEQGLLNDLDRLDRAIITEAEYTTRATARRDETEKLEARRGELQARLSQEKSAQEQARRVPAQIRSFFEDFTQMDVRQQKVQLQLILKAAHVKKGEIEVEFR